MILARRPSRRIGRRPMRKTIGAVMIALPFVGWLALCLSSIGLVPTICILALVALVAALIFGGVWLFNG